MGRTATADLDLVKLAVAKMIRHPTISASEAMQLAGFSEEEWHNRSTQRLIYRHLPGKSKRNLAAATSANSSGNNVGVIVSCAASAPTISPLTGSTPVSSTTATGTVTTTTRRPKIRRLNSQQKQDQRVETLARKNLFSAAHKAATTTYDEERKKEDGMGMSVRKVATKIKSEFGVGPSATTIHRYVADLGLVGQSPMKMGPVGQLPPVVYKALCTAISSKLRINQLNAKGSFTINKQVQLIMMTMGMSKAEATPLWKRVSRDTAFDIVAGKVKFAEERRVQLADCRKKGWMT